MNKIEQAYINGFIKAAQPNNFEPYYKDGIQSSPLSLLTGSIAPIKGSTETVYDAMLRNQSDQQKLNLGSQALASTPMFSNLGMRPNNPFTKLLSYYMSQPSSTVSKVLRPFLGGNPVAASNDTYNSLKGLSGMNL